VKTCYCLYVGSERDLNNRVIPADIRSDMLDRTERLTAETFGGYSITNVTGGWLSPSDVLVREISYRIEITTDADYETVWTWANRVRTLFRQYSVLLTSYRLNSSANVENDYVNLPVAA
jgi:hypothetical protein